ncbi:MULTISPECIES: exodeoxyribonuclease VII large subunit [unclassified Corynebacterium]|uniref:exodeoxyribonuclease VII large subunit n=1 Tax=unclassified Corynebacterium TaxID=2624378 RepID=UPI0037C08F49
MDAAHSPENAWPVREFNNKVKGWIERLGTIWVEGQVTQLKANPRWRYGYLTLRDVEVEASVSVTCPHELLATIHDGDRIVCFGRPQFYEGRGSFSLHITKIEHLGLGAMLARIEKLRQQLAAEGLSDPTRKKPLPFLPRRIGLITGRGSAAERDVLSVARLRWPEVEFEVINTAVQGARAVPEIIAALKTLDEHPDVDVIIIARGGGSVEDLLPFSEEALQRQVVATHTPVVSAIGHEPDRPVLDDIADLRAATPTDAAKRVVPDVVAERELIKELRYRSSQALRGWVYKESRALRDLRMRPVLARPMSLVDQHVRDLSLIATQLDGTIHRYIDGLNKEMLMLRKQVSTLGPAATLERGYAVVQVLPRDGTPPEVVTSIQQSPPGSQLRIRVNDGSITAAAMQNKPAD